MCSTHKTLIVKNLFNKDFKTNKIYLVWRTDISYIDTWELCFYFIIVKDIFKKEISSMSYSQ